MKNICDNYCVALVDILGFRDMTCNISKINTYAPILNEAIDYMKSSEHLNDKLVPLVSKTKIINIQGADSLFFIFPKEFFNLYVASIRIMVLQLRLAMKGIYIRGAICNGALYIDEENDIYFGEAWNKAVELEKEAGNPRIVLENSLARFFKDELKRIYGESVAEFHLDDDGFYILSTYGFYTDMYFDKKQKDPFYEVFYSLKKNISIKKDNKVVLRKYLWMVKEIESENYRQEIKEIAKELYNEILSYLTYL